MPILGSSGLSFTIGDLANEVIKKTENRTTDVERARQWLVDALVEISSNQDYRDDFDELEVVGPTFDLTVGVQEYDQSNIVPAGDLNQATLDIVIFVDPPGNKIRRKLQVTHYQEVDKFQIVQSLPVQWYRFGSTIGFNPLPDKAYRIQARILRYHPIADPGVQSTVVLLPREWNEILVWSAVERGFAELLEFEKAAAIGTLLRGDPRYPDKPGLIFGRKKRRQKEIFRKEQALRPVLRAYGYGGKY